MNIFVIIQQHLVFLCASCRVYKVYLVLPPINSPEDILICVFHANTESPEFYPKI